MSQASKIIFVNYEAPWISSERAVTSKREMSQFQSKVWVEHNENWDPTSDDEKTLRERLTRTRLPSTDRPIKPNPIPEFG